MSMGQVVKAYYRKHWKYIKCNFKLSPKTTLSHNGRQHMKASRIRSEIYIHRSATNKIINNTEKKAREQKLGEFKFISQLQSELPLVSR